jgi:hypothetical protein
VATHPAARGRDPFIDLDGTVPPLAGAPVLTAASVRDEWADHVDAALRDGGCPVWGSHGRGRVIRSTTRQGVVPAMTGAAAATARPSLSSRRLR